MALIEMPARTGLAGMLIQSSRIKRAELLTADVQVNARNCAASCSPTPWSRAVSADRCRPIPPRSTARPSTGAMRASPDRLVWDDVLDVNLVRGPLDLVDMLETDASGIRTATDTLVDNEVPSSSTLC
jgi:hypothetical protein